MLQEFAARQRLFLARLTLGVERLAQELDIGDAGDLDRILEAEEQASRRTLVRVQIEQVLARLQVVRKSEIEKLREMVSDLERKVEDLLASRIPS